MIDDESVRLRFRQVQLVPLTAFDARGELNLAVMEKQTERLLAAGVTVFIPCAGSSEFHSLDMDEIVAAVHMTRQVVGDRARVVAPVGLQLRYAKELARRACEAGADSLLVMPLTFPYVSNAGSRDYYESLLDAVACPVLIYKKDLIPSPELLNDLAHHPRLLGVKYSLPDVTAFQRIVELDGSRLEWYCGHAERYAPYFMLAGAPAYTSGAGNLCPRITLAMHRALQAGEFAEAFKWQRLIFPIEEYRARDGNSYNVSFLKYALSHLGLDFGDPRPPYRRLTSAERVEIDRIVAPILKAEDELAT